MRRLFTILFALLCLRCSAQFYTAVIQVTNTAGTTNGQWYAVTNAMTPDKRTWTNAVFIPATQILTNNSQGGAAANMINQAALHPFGGFTIGTVPYGITLRSNHWVAVGISPGWASVIYMTNLSGTGLVVRSPLEVETNANVITNIVSNLAQGGKYSTNAWEAPGFVALGTGTNQLGVTALTNLQASQFLILGSDKIVTNTLDGSTLTNLLLQLDTNAIPAAASLSFGHAYTTNLTRDITLPAFTISATAYYEELVLICTNGNGSDHKVTGPAGTKGPPGSGSPPALYCTNGQVTIIKASHYGKTYTNMWKLDFAP